MTKIIIFVLACTGCQLEKLEFTFDNNKYEIKQNYPVPTYVVNYHYDQKKLLIFSYINVDDHGHR